MRRSIICFSALSLLVGAQLVQAQPGPVGAQLGDAAGLEYQYEETRELVRLVNDAAELVHARGEAAFADLRLPGSRWRQAESYVFVLDTGGIMLVHPDAAMEGRNQLDLEDVDGRPIVRGLIGAATTLADKPEGWYHYQWPVPGGLIPRWKSTYVRLVSTPTGARYVVGSGVYNDRMERSFVVDAVEDAVGRIEKEGAAAFRLFRDPIGPFMAKDAYVFVVDSAGVELVNPAFPSLEGRNILDVKDSHGKQLVREMLEVARSRGSGWVEYMWPKPGESVSTRKSAYVSRARMGDQWLVVGSGVYLADAPKAIAAAPKMTARELMTLVRDAAPVFERGGEKAFAEFREKGSRWFRDDTYFFAWTLDGTRVFHAASPESEGVDVRDLQDVLGRPIGKMFLEAAATPNGEGWGHYMYPEPGEIFPTWKSTFVKRVTFPSGRQHLIGCGIYNMAMDRAFIEDVVERAAALVADLGADAFDRLRDETGAFVFMDTYVFVTEPDGTELVNAAQPSLEGKNLIDVTDLYGKPLVRDYIDAALSEGSAWIDYYWYRPGQNTPALKHTYVKKVRSGENTYIVGSGFYAADEGGEMTDIRKTSWTTIEEERLSDSLSRQVVFGDQATLARLSARSGTTIGRHSHASEEYAWITAGALKYMFGDREEVVGAGEILVVPPNVPHTIDVLEDSTFVIFFAPGREDWKRGEDRYLRTESTGTD
jgi:signal transduction histidine kinase